MFHIIKIISHWDDYIKEIFMKTTKNILIAFVLNLSFSVFELFGGILTGSVAILSDSIHDLGDAASIGVSLFLERKSQKEANEVYTYGYARYSALGSAFTLLILFVGSAIVITNAIGRIISPAPIHYDGMIVFAVLGVIINTIAAFITREGSSLNQKAVNLHMLEDVLGWIVVLIGAIIMRFTDCYLLDPIMSIAVAIFILIESFRQFKEILDLFLEKTPTQIHMFEIQTAINALDGVSGIHHIHIWSLDGKRNYATMHIVTDSDPCQIKTLVRKKLSELGIHHATLELESSNESCPDKDCRLPPLPSAHHCHHHHH